MLACARIGAIHSVVFGGFASVSPGQPHRGRDAKAHHQRRCRQPRRQAHRLQAAAGRGHRLVRAQTRQRADGGPRHGGLRARRRTRPGLRRTAPPPCGCSRALRLAGVQHAELHPLHQRHDRKTEGRAARCGRLCSGLGRQYGLDLRRQAGRDLFLHQRHRLGRRPQLHRLRPVDCRHGHADVRGHAGQPGCRRAVEPGREVPGDGDVQCADRGARAEEA